MNNKWKLICISTGSDLGAEFDSEKDAIKFRNRKMRTNPKLRFYVARNSSTRILEDKAAS